MSIITNLLLCLYVGSDGGRVVKLLAGVARGPRFDSRLCHLNSEIGYLLLPSRDMAEIPLKRRKSSIQPTNQPTNQPPSLYVKF